MLNSETRDEVLVGQDRPALVGKRAVIVEDEGVTQLQLRRSLTRMGLNVIGVANNGDGGVELVLRERPDVVLMDILMPGAIDGLEAARQILAEIRVCIVMLTAYSLEDYRNRAKAIGACAYLLKPIDSETLAAELEKAYLGFHPA